MLILSKNVAKKALIPIVECGRSKMLWTSVDSKTITELTNYG